MILKANYNGTIREFDIAQTTDVPNITATKSGTTTTIYKNGTSIATILDGATGSQGEKGDKGDTGNTGHKVSKVKKAILATLAYISVLPLQLTMLTYGLIHLVALIMCKPHLIL